MISRTCIKNIRLFNVSLNWLRRPLSASTDGWVGGRGGSWASWLAPGTPGWFLGFLAGSCASWLATGHGLAHQQCVHSINIVHRDAAGSETNIDLKNLLTA